MLFGTNEVTQVDLQRRASHIQAELQSQFEKDAFAQARRMTSNFMNQRRDILRQVKRLGECGTSLCRWPILAVTNSCLA